MRAAGRNAWIKHHPTARVIFQVVVRHCALAKNAAHGPQALLVVKALKGQIFSLKPTRPWINHFLRRNKDVQISLSINTISIGRAHNTPFHDKRRLHTLYFFYFFWHLKLLISRAQAVKVSSGAITRPTSTFSNDPPPSLPISKALWWKEPYSWSTYQELKVTIGGAPCWNQWYR